MTTIHKYTLPFEGFCVVKAPRGADFISVLNQREQLVVYAKVNTDVDQVEHHFRVAGTGHPVGVLGPV